MNSALKKVGKEGKSWVGARGNLLFGLRRPSTGKGAERNGEGGYLRPEDIKEAITLRILWRYLERTIQATNTRLWPNSQESEVSAGKR